MPRSGSGLAPVVGRSAGSISSVVRSSRLALSGARQVACAFQDLLGTSSCRSHHPSLPAPHPIIDGGVDFGGRAGLADELHGGSKQMATSTATWIQARA
ncbi:hypothetical protein DAI22_10g092300 [Oryza sativa Japonica Group]|jgi:hypothetical protein|uniref:cDNA clone:J013135P11, full insert sequence n=2 Tax=Oryza TaxID=4527 RepID=B7EEF8_ORYSJ|nr:hypothetical protein DAI22_10g092300 [Oryza sativa Japonica Group]BAG90755.1 unnamed protein product [Oryza sativa Japonica Group]BAG96019.1 unnamed protein product [Oryza sativa Japonica Group]